MLLPAVYQVVSAVPFQICPATKALLELLLGVTIGVSLDDETTISGVDELLTTTLGVSLDDETITSGADELLTTTLGVSLDDETIASGADELLTTTLGVSLDDEAIASGVDELLGAASSFMSGKSEQERVNVMASARDAAKIV
ncbi:hypothetical protein R83H12_01534 [Fibrobacteria bacterium R8-3-H12]